MGIGGISPVQLIIILVIVLLIFGSRKLRNLGGDLGSAVKGFKKAVKEEGSDQESDQESAPESRSLTSLKCPSPKPWRMNLSPRKRKPK